VATPALVTPGAFRISLITYTMDTGALDSTMLFRGFDELCFHAFDPLFWTFLDGVMVNFMLLILLCHELGDIFKACCQLVHLLWLHVLIVVVLNLLNAFLEVFVNMLAFVLHFFASDL
jgi:hypothetical protein